MFLFGSRFYSLFQRFYLRMPQIICDLTGCYAMPVINTGTTAISIQTPLTAVTCAYSRYRHRYHRRCQHHTTGVCTRIDTAKKSDTGTTAGKRKNGKCMCIERRSAWKKRLCIPKKLQNYIVKIQTRQI